MSEDTDLRAELQRLRAQLDTTDPLEERERAELNALITDIEARLPLQPEDSLVDGVNLAVERFEVSHPTLAGTLRNILQSLASMGI